MADMNGVQRREVMRTDDPFGIPACFYWTVDEVADWIESIGYGKYKENFRSHFINGRKLLTVDACVLPRMGITHFGDILALSRCVGELTSRRVLMEEPLPLAKTPRLYQANLDASPAGNDHMALTCYSMQPATVSRMLQSVMSYPWSYLTWRYY